MKPTETSTSQWWWWGSVTWVCHPLHLLLLLFLLLLLRLSPPPLPSNMLFGHSIQEPQASLLGPLSPFWLSFMPFLEDSSPLGRLVLVCEREQWPMGWTVTQFQVAHSIILPGKCCCEWLDANCCHSIEWSFCIAGRVPTLFREVAAKFPTSTRRDLSLWLFSSDNCFFFFFFASVVLITIWGLRACHRSLLFLYASL